MQNVGFLMTRLTYVYHVCRREYESFGNVIKWSEEVCTKNIYDREKHYDDVILVVLQLSNAKFYTCQRHFVSSLCLCESIKCAIVLKKYTTSKLTSFWILNFASDLHAA